MTTNSDSSLTVDGEEHRSDQTAAKSHGKDRQNGQPTSPQTGKRRRDLEGAMFLGEVEDTGPQPNDDLRHDKPAIKRAKVADERGDDEVPARNGCQDETGPDDSDYKEGEQRESREGHRDEERRERNEQGWSHSRRRSPVAESSARDAPSRRKVSVSQEERKRGQRLFGGLLSTLSTLSQPARRSAPQAHRRQEPEQRQQQPLSQQQQPEKRESREDKQRQAERVAKLATTRKIEQVKFDERVMLARHSNLLALARNLQTRSEPKLYYRPWERSKQQEQIIEDQILAAEEIIKREANEFARQKRERLALLGVGTSSPPHEPEDTTGAAKTEVEDNAMAEPTAAASKEPEDQEPDLSLPSAMSPPPPVSDEKDGQAEEAEVSERHDDQRHRHDHDDRDRDIMVETEEDTVIY